MSIVVGVLLCLLCCLLLLRNVWNVHGARNEVRWSEWYTYVHLITNEINETRWKLLWCEYGQNEISVHAFSITGTRLWRPTLSWKHHLHQGRCSKCFSLRLENLQFFQFWFHGLGAWEIKCWSGKKHIDHTVLKVHCLEWLDQNGSLI